MLQEAALEDQKEHQKETSRLGNGNGYRLRVTMTDADVHALDSGFGSSCFGFTMELRGPVS